MTRGEAIKYGTEWLNDEYLDAKDRAFIKISLEALEQEPCEAISPTAIPLTVVEEATKLLYAEWKREVRKDNSNNRLLVAYKMAIKALEELPKRRKEAKRWKAKAMQHNSCNDDVISRQTAIDACDQSINILEATDRIKDLPSVTPKQRWIPVSERLPEEREWYLAVFKEKDTGFQIIPRVADYIGNGENEWRIIDWEDEECQEYRDILECIAWMPLPKPYDPQESEEV